LRHSLPCAEQARRTRSRPRPDRPVPRSPATEAAADRFPEALASRAPPRFPAVRRSIAGGAATLLPRVPTGPSMCAASARCCHLLDAAPSAGPTPLPTPSRLSPLGPRHRTRRACAFRTRRTRPARAGRACVRTPPACANRVRRARFQPACASRTRSPGVGCSVSRLPVSLSRKP